MHTANIYNWYLSVVNISWNLLICTLIKIKFMTSETQTKTEITLFEQWLWVLFPNIKLFFFCKFQKKKKKKVPLSILAPAETVPVFLLCSQIFMKSYLPTFHSFYLSFIVNKCVNADLNSELSCEKNAPKLTIIKCSWTVQTKMIKLSYMPERVIQN